MREQARLVSMAIQLLTIPTEANCLSPASLYHMVCQEDPAGSCDHQEKPQNQVSSEERAKPFDFGPTDTFIVWLILLHQCSQNE